MSEEGPSNPVNGNNEINNSIDPKNQTDLVQSNENPSEKIPESSHHQDQHSKSNESLPNNSSNNNQLQTADGPKDQALNENSNQKTKADNQDKKSINSSSKDTAQPQGSKLSSELAEKEKQKQRIEDMKAHHQSTMFKKKEILSTIQKADEQRYKQLVKMKGFLNNSYKVINDKIDIFHSSSIKLHAQLKENLNNKLQLLEERKKN